jgi:antitoxin HicB
MVLLHGFIKKSRKTPDEDFELARNNQSRHQKGTPMNVRKKHKRTDHSGSTFSGFLEEVGIREEVEAVAIKRVLAWQLEKAMQEQQKTKQTMAKQLHTSRSQLDRLLDPRNVSVTLDTIIRAARVLGKRIIIRVADARAKPA